MGIRANVQPEICHCESRAFAAGDGDEDAEILGTHGLGIPQVLQRYVFAVPRLGPARSLFFLRTADYTVAGAWADGVQ